MTPEQIMAAIMALPPDQQMALKAQMGQMADAPAAPAAPAPAMPAPGPQAAAQMGDKADEEPEWFKKFSESCTKRFGDLEAAWQAKEKTGDEQQMAAFSDRLDRLYAAKGQKKVTPAEWEAKRKLALESLATAKFSDAATATAFFSAIEQQFDALPVNPLVSSVVRDAPAAPITDAARRLASHTDLGRRTLAKLESRAAAV